MKKSISSFLLFVVFLTVVVLVIPYSVAAKSDNSSKPEKSENSNPGQDKKEERTAVVGKVEKVQGNTIIVEDKKQNKKNAVIEKDTKMVGKDNKPIKLNQIKAEDKIAVISSESAKLKKVVKVFIKDASSSAQSKRRAIQGLITGVNGSVITIAHQIQRDRVYQILINGQTIIQSKSTEASGSAALQVGIRIVAVGDLGENGQLVARRIHVIPGKAKGIFKKYPLSSGSAIPSSSPSATPEATASATP